ncbi:MAG: ABC transporter permease [Acidobacteria bacterium]|nr:MAG: ABC transporter permease [Acidobacteriota bacterium]
MWELSQIAALLQKRERARRVYTSLWVTAREAFWIALEALRTHKLRSFLTLLGVVIATTTLIVVMSVINGMNLYIADHIANLGANVFVVSQFNWAAQDEEWLRERRRNKPLRIDDYEFLKENLGGYKNIGASVWFWPRPEVHYKGQVIFDVQLVGETPSMIDMEQEQVEYGRYLTDSDYGHSAAVCFIGRDLVDKFFPSVDPLDKVIEIGGQSFRVIGVAKKIGTTLGQTQDSFAQIPLTTFQKLFRARPRMNIQVQAWGDRQMLDLEDEARALMRARHHLAYQEKDDFGINASATIMGIWTDLTGKMFMATTIIVAVFMVVGGIVIMNIMLASVTERTHEIGIRKSLGARRRDISMQFVIESGVIAGMGGVIGIVLALILSKIVDVFFTASVPAGAVVVGITLSTAVGLFFGIYPAWKAAQLDPIEALRTEN